MSQTIEAEIVEPSEEKSTALTFAPQGHQAVIEAAREAKTIEMMFWIAQKSPRDLVQINADIKELCSDRDFAEVALYKYTRGGAIVGASIRLIEEICNIFGRLKPAWEVLYIADNKAYVRAFCIDMQSLNMPERKFFVELGEWVKTGKKDKNGADIKEYKPKTDERDIRERIANIAQRAMRTQMEACIGKRLIRKAIRQVEETLVSGPKMKEGIDAMVKQFYSVHGVTTAMICKYLDITTLDSVTSAMYVDMVAVWNTLKDKETKVSDYFEVKASAPEADAPPEAKPATSGKPGRPRANKNASASDTSHKTTSQSQENAVAGSTASDSGTTTKNVESGAPVTTENMPVADLGDLFG